MNDPISQVQDSSDMEVSFNIKSTEVVNRESGTGQPNVEEFATVRAEIESTFEVAGESQTETNTQTMTVAKTPDGEWKYWQSG